MAFWNLHSKGVDRKKNGYIVTSESRTVVKDNKARDIPDFVGRPPEGSGILQGSLRLQVSIRLLKIIPEWRQKDGSNQGVFGSRQTHRAGATDKVQASVLGLARVFHDGSSEWGEFRSREGRRGGGGDHMHRVCAVFRFCCEARIHLNVLRHGLLY